MCTKSRSVNTRNAAILLTIAAALSILMQVVLNKLQTGSRLVIVACFTGYELELFFAAVMWISFLGLLTAFCVYTTNKKHKLARNVITSIAVVFVEIPLTLYLFLLLVSSTKSPHDPVKLKSPDGKHSIVRTSDWCAGMVLYSYYAKDEGVVYRFLFYSENSVSDPDFEWTDNGILYKDELYEY